MSHLGLNIYLAELRFPLPWHSPTSKEQEEIRRALLCNLIIDPRYCNVQLRSFIHKPMLEPLKKLAGITSFLLDLTCLLARPVQLEWLLGYEIRFSSKGVSPRRLCIYCVVGGK